VLDGATNELLQDIRCNQLLPSAWTSPPSIGPYPDVAAITSDGGRLAVYVRPKEDKDPAHVLVLDVKNGKRLWERPLDAAVSLDRIVAGAGVVGLAEATRVLFLDATTGAIRETVGKSVTCIAASRDGLTFWAGTKKGELFVVKRLSPAAPK
jgi:outer membrane protein assembly factor BamB